MYVSLNVSGKDVNDDQVDPSIKDNVNIAIQAADVIGGYFFLVKRKKNI